MATWSNGAGPTAGDDRYQGDAGSGTASGLAGADTLIGGAGADSLSGGEGADLLRGGLGRDTLDGGTGEDTLNGGEGADTYIVRVGDGADTFRDLGFLGVDRVVIVGGGDYYFLKSGFGPENGIEEIQYDALPGNAISLFGGDGPSDSFFSRDDLRLDFSETRLVNVGVVFGGYGNDRIVGPDHAMRLDGFEGNDTLIGGRGADDLLGGLGGDVLRGGASADTLSGGSGVDTLEGGAGPDVYLFDTFPERDIVRGFVSGQDQIVLDGDIFRVLRTGAPHTLPESQFRVGAAALDGDDHILYDPTTGDLKYDVDGNGTGVPLTFARLAGSPTVTSQDFFVGV